MATETQDAAEVAQGAAEAAHGSAPGMPQLDFSTFSNQIFWLAVTLIAIYLILSRVALPRIAAVLAERQGTISNDIAAAEDLKAKAIEAENIYNKALADARAEAQRIVAEARAEIQVGLDEAIARADVAISAKATESEKAIAEIKAGALDGIKSVANDTAAEIVTAFGGKSSAKVIAAAVSDRMKG